MADNLSKSYESESPNALASLIGADTSLDEWCLTTSAPPLDRDVELRELLQVYSQDRQLIYEAVSDYSRFVHFAPHALLHNSIAEVLRSVGGQIRQSWCGPCFGQGPDALHKGQRAITSFNRNWQNRMGVGGEGYLASPAVVAASAMIGYMAPPSELGLKWDPEKFGV